MTAAMAPPSAQVTLATVRLVILELVTTDPPSLQRAHDQALTVSL